MLRLLVVKVGNMLQLPPCLTGTTLKFMGEQSYSTTYSELQHHMEFSDELQTRYTLDSLRSSRPSLDTLDRRKISVPAMHQILITHHSAHTTVSST
jgi:hypothetical protein